MSTSALRTPHRLTARSVRPRIPRRRVAATLLAAAALLATVLTGTAQATTPPPDPGTTPGVSTTAFGGISAFYKAATGQLIHRRGTATAWDAAENLGGRLTGGPTAITIGSEFAGTWVFVTGTDNRVWYRQFSDGKGEWSDWSTLGGWGAGNPATTCVGDFTAQPIVYVRGKDNALWRRTLTGAWHRLGGVLIAHPSALPAVGGGCPSREDVFVTGTDRGVWEYRSGAFRRVPGGQTQYAPAAVEHPGGRTDLFVRGLDDALWMNTRASVTAAWTGWRRVGGILSSAPAANLFPQSPLTRVVLALGADGDLWQGRNVVGTSTWRWSEVP